jgi:quercetin dioxygenase-like cupin family protein
MLSLQLNHQELVDFWHDEVPRARGKGGFPLNGAPGTESVGMVYFEIEPGDNLGLHTDSADEVIVVLAGTAIGTIGDESGVLSAGSIAFIPAMMPHGFENTGDDTLRCLGVFPDSKVVSTFEYALHPFGTRVLEFEALGAAPSGT